MVSVEYVIKHAAVFIFAKYITLLILYLSPLALSFSLSLTLSRCSFIHLPSAAIVGSYAFSCLCLE